MSRAKEWPTYGITRAAFKEMIEATIKQREKKAGEDRGETRRNEERKQKEAKQRSSAEERKSKEEERREREETRERERKEKEIAAELKTIAKLPTVAHALRLQELAKRLDADIEGLREQLQYFIVPDEIADEPQIAPWAENDLVAQLRRFVIVNDDNVLAVAVWILFAWCHEIARYSPPLLITSADIGSGKSALATVAGRLCPRLNRNVEMTAAGFFRTIDREKPTLLLDEADDIFKTGVAFRSLVNDSWQHGANVKRVGPGGRIQRFSIFCPKIITMKGTSALPEATASRCIIVKMKPKLESEQVEDYVFVSDEEEEHYLILQRKCLRWAADNIEQLKSAKPVMPPGVINRAAANWHLASAFADLAGGDMPKRVRAAAVKLLAKSEGVRLSEGQRLLAAMQPIIKARKEILSADLAEHLHSDPEGEWRNFRGRGKITTTQIAVLLRQYDVYPVDLHPIRGSTKSLRGYRLEDFVREQVFERHLPTPPRKSASPQLKSTNRRK
jgi:flagellar biosynthesis GTPase FlhF